MQSARTVTGIIERAYEIARSGRCASTSEVVKALKKDGFVDGLIELHFAGRMIRKELSSICKSSQASAAETDQATPVMAQA